MKVKQDLEMKHTACSKYLWIGIKQKVVPDFFKFVFQIHLNRLHPCSFSLVCYFNLLEVFQSRAKHGHIFLESKRIEKQVWDRVGNLKK